MLHHGSKTICPCDTISRLKFLICIKNVNCSRTNPKNLSLIKVFCRITRSTLIESALAAPRAHNNIKFQNQEGGPECTQSSQLDGGRSLACCPACACRLHKHPMIPSKPSMPTESYKATVSDVISTLPLESSSNISTHRTPMQPIHKTKSCARTAMATNTSQWRIGENR